MMKTEQKPIIYQLLPRLYANYSGDNVRNGTIKQNGSGKMNTIDSNTLKSIKALGVTHVWYTGIIEHANRTDYSQQGIQPANAHVVKGKAGSPYAIIDYYDVDPDIADDVPNRMKEFEALVQRTHQAGLKVIIDFIPNHVARQYHSDAKPDGVEDLGANDNNNIAFSPNNDFYYLPQQRFEPSFNIGQGTDSEYVEYPAKATGNDCFNAHPGINDWYETVKLNYGIDYINNTGCHFEPIPPLWYKMLDILKFWTCKKIDGFRCDMVHMVPVEFFQWAIPQVKALKNDMIFIAELYEPSIYRRYLEQGCFDYLYDKVGLYDTLFGVVRGERSAHEITWCWQSLEGIADKMLNFMENHDELRIASRQFAGSARNGLPAAVVSATLNRAPFMLYFGQELGERGADIEGYSGDDGRTTIFDYWRLDTMTRFYNSGRCNNTHLTPDERYTRKFYRSLLHICNNERAICWGRMYDLMYLNMNNLNPHRHFAYLRHYKNEVILIVVNFDNNEAHLDINLPYEVLQFMNVPKGSFQVKELLNKQGSWEMNIDGNTPLHVDIEPNNAVILKWRATMRKKSEKK